MAKKKEMYGNDETVERVCAFCEYAISLPTSDGEENDVICEKRGVVRADYVCGKFRYDLLKRTPKDKPALSSLVAVSLDE